MRAFALPAFIALAMACSPLAPPVRALEAHEASATLTIAKVEPGEPPNFVVHGAPAGGEAMRFDLNASDADLGGVAPADFAGRAALIYYTQTETSFLLDIRTAEGRSLLYDDGRGVPAEGASITGVLRYTGDRGDDAPEQISVASADGATQTFTYYVDRRIGGWSGRPVTAYYDIEVRRHITLMRPR